MHEATIVEGLMRILETRAARHGVTAIRRVNLKVGRLRAVEPRQLVACFEMFAEGTVAEGALLAIDEVAVRARCRGCGSEFAVARYRFVCPACGSGDVEVIQGQELYIESFEATGTDPPDGRAGDAVPK